MNSKDYDLFAPCYDVAMGDRKEEALLTLKLIRAHRPHAKTLLELGCGTGSMLKILSKSFVCTGVDYSAHMIKQARKKVPNAKYVVQDITQFYTEQRFDVVLCAFDTVNHLRAFKDWRRLFQRAGQHLRPEGIFVFDMNTEKKLQQYSLDPPFARIQGNAVSVFETKKVSSAKYTIHINVFEPGRKKQYTKREITVYESTFPLERVVRELARHFQNVNLIDLDREEPDDQSEELYFVCSNPRPRTKTSQNKNSKS